MGYIIFLLAGSIFIMSQRDQANKTEAMACKNTLNECRGMCYDF